jgi:hypothetical protein
VDKPRALALLLEGGHHADMSTPIPDDLLSKLTLLAAQAMPPEGRESSSASIAPLVELKRSITPEVLLSLLEEVAQGRRTPPARPQLGDLLVRK